MTIKQQDEFKKLVKEGTIEALVSDEGKNVIKEGALEALVSNEGKNVIKEGVLEALKSNEGQGAVVEALASKEGQETMIKVLKSPEAKEIFEENFADAFHEIVAPVFEDRDKKTENFKKRIENLEQKTGMTI